MALSESSDQPSVTCLITAHNHGAFVEEAVRSVLTQDYPPDRLRVVVVNDGSTDETGAVLASAFSSEPRVTIIDQENQGFIGATNVALGAAAGELIAILDSDDAWTPGRLARQVDIFRARPEVGLVHGDMRLVDASCRVLHPSYFEWSGFDVPRGRMLARLMRGPNFVTASAIVFRSEFLPEIYPVPVEAIYPDWYYATRIAQHAEIDHPDGPVSVYRMHGANMGLGGTGRKFFEDMRQNVRVQRWMLRTLRVDREEVAGLADVVAKMRHDAMMAAARLGESPDQILPVTGGDRESAIEALALAESRSDRGTIADVGRALVMAAAHDPWNEVVVARLAAALRAPADVGKATTRRQAVVAFADELMANPSMLADYGSVVSGDADVTLVIWTPDESNELAGTLSRVVEDCGLDGDDASDLLLHCSTDLADALRFPVVAVYSCGEPRPALADLPHVAGAHDIRELLAAADALS